MALSIAKYIEIKTQKSIRATIELLQSAVDARIINKTTNQEFILQAEIKSEVREVLEKMEMSY